MIRAVLSENVRSFAVDISGHSGKRGQSLVCAGVSALAESWRLAEHLLEGIPSTVSEGSLRAEVPKTDTSKVLFFQLAVGLKALAQQHPSEIEINIGGHHGI